jgi:transposase
MHDHEFFAKVLGLEEPWEVKNVTLDLPGTRVEVTLECQPGHGWVTPDGQRLHVHGWEERRWRHLDTMQLETVLVARVPRLLDPQSGRTEMATVPWAKKGARWTALFEAWAVRLLQAVPNVSRAADLLRLDWHSAWEMKARAVARGLERRQAEPIAALGLDEKSFGRGQDYATVLTDPAGRRVLEVVAGRTQEAAEGVLEGGLAPQQRPTVEAVSIDMWPAFEAAVGTKLPQARIVYDPFHVVSHVNVAVDTVRRAEHRHRQRAGDETLKGSRQLWLHGYERLDRDKRRELRALLLAPELQTGLAWALKEQLRELWDYRRPSAARKFLDGWRERVAASGLAPLKKVAKMIFAHLTGILAWFWHPISNGPAEGFNSAIQTLKNIARGYRNFANFRIAILFHHGKLDLAPH